MTQSKAEIRPSELAADSVLRGGQPNSPSEKYMAALWHEIVGLEQVQLADRFLDVGGNSLTLNVILKRVETEKGVLLKARQFFEPERSSLRDIAAELETMCRAKAELPQ